MSHSATFEPIDSLTGSRPTIDSNHYMIHAGKSYHLISANASVASSSTCTIAITVPATGEIHAYFGVSTNGPLKTEIYESPTISGGTAITAYNRDRDSTNAATLTAVKDPTITTTGNVLLAIGRTGTGGVGKTQIGGDSPITSEWILGAGKTYIYRITSQAAATAIDLGLDWYEVT
jgi:hypothetical protein